MDKTELRKYRDLAAEVRQIQGRLKALEGSMYDAGGQRYTRTPTGKADLGRTMEAAVDKHREVCQLYAGKLLELNTEMERIELAIQALDNPEERMLLRYRYLDGMDWFRIEGAMHYGHSQIHRVHGSALVHLREEGHTCADGE